MDERVKWTIIFGAIACFLIGAALPTGWFALILPLFWAVFVLWYFPRDHGTQRVISTQTYEENNEDDEESDEEEDHEAEEEDEDIEEDDDNEDEEEEDEDDEDENEDNTGWIVAYCRKCGKKIKHKVDLETRNATCTVCGRTWKYKGNSW